MRQTTFSYRAVWYHLSRTTESHAQTCRADRPRHFTDKWFKNGEHIALGNYGPRTILPFFSKLTEKCISDFLMAYRSERRLRFVYVVCVVFYRPAVPGCVICVPREECVPLFPFIPHGLSHLIWRVFCPCVTGPE